MTIFTFILDLSITQAYAIYQKKAYDKKDSRVSFFEFKRRIFQSLIGGSQCNKRPRSPNILETEEREQSQPGNSEGRLTIATSLGAINETHMLVKNLPRNQMIMSFKT
jgi:hypothetical protein